MNFHYLKILGDVESPIALTYLIHAQVKIQLLGLINYIITRKTVREYFSTKYGLIFFYFVEIRLKENLITDNK